MPTESKMMKASDWICVMETFWHFHDEGWGGETLPFLFPDFAMSGNIHTFVPENERGVIIPFNFGLEGRGVVAPAFVLFT